MPLHIETSPLLCRATQWTGFYMIMASVIKELIFFDDLITNLRKFKTLMTMLSHT